MATHLILRDWLALSHLPMLYAFATRSNLSIENFHSELLHTAFTIILNKTQSKHCQQRTCSLPLSQSLSVSNTSMVWAQSSARPSNCVALKQRVYWKNRHHNSDGRHAHSVSNHAPYPSHLPDFSPLAHRLPSLSYRLQALLQDADTFV